MDIDKAVDQVLEVSGKERKGIDPHTGEKLPPHGRTYLNVQKGTTRHVKGKAKVELKPFSEMDWSAWSGAEKFPDDNEPLIGYYEGSSSESEASSSFIAIVDANGIQIIFGEDKPEDNSYQLHHKFHTQQGAKHEAEHILAKVQYEDEDALDSLGFEQNGLGFEKI